MCSIDGAAAKRTDSTSLDTCGRAECETSLDKQGVRPVCALAGLQATNKNILILLLIKYTVERRDLRVNRVL